MTTPNTFNNNPLLQKPNSIREFTPEQVEEIAKCYADPIYFANKHCKIVTLDQGLVQVTLFPYQEEMIKKALNNDFTICKFARQSGKLLSNNQYIPTPTGFRKMGELKVGDQVIDEFGNPCNVIFVSEEQNVKAYRITFDDGSTVDCCEDHQWTVYDRIHKKYYSENYVRTKTEHPKITTTTKALYESEWRRKNNTGYYEYSYYIPNTEPVKYQKVATAIDPYLLGLWLGDGISAGYKICSKKQDLDFYCSQLSEQPYKWYKQIKGNNIWLASFESLKPTNLNNYNLINNKHIPAEYLYNDIQTRIALLQGLMDTDGFVEKKQGSCHIQLSLKYSRLLDDVYILLCSLGLKVTKKHFPKTNSLRYSWTVGRDKFNVCRIPHKLERQKETICQPRYVYSRTIQNIEPIENITGRCIQVDSPNSLYLCTESFIPTHNTTGVVILMTWLAIFNPRFSICIVAQKEKQAKEILGRIKIAYENLPDWLKIGVTSWSATFIELENGSKIVVSGTSSAAARGGSINFLYLDEFAFVPEHIQYEFYNSVFPTISAGKSSKVMITSTPCGLNLFYKIWNDSEQGNNDFARVEINWWDVPGRDEEWKEKMLRAMGEDAFNQEFNAEFLGSSNTLIAGPVLKSLTWKTPVKSENGLSIYQFPAAGKHYIIVADVARGINLDYSACIIIDVTTWPYKLVAKFQSNKIQPVVFAQTLATLGKYYNEAYALVENNDVGSQVADVMHREFEYGNLFAYHTRNKNKNIHLTSINDAVANIGVKTSKLVKRLGCSNLKQLIESRKLIVEDYDIIKQLSVFVLKNKSYEADNGNDDLVMTLVLFGWLIDQPYFQQLSNGNFSRHLIDEYSESTQQNLRVFGFINTAEMFDDSVDEKGFITATPAQFDEWWRDDWGIEEKEPDPESTFTFNLPKF